MRFQKLSDFPVSVSDGWSAEAGDSIILKESNSPAGMFTVVNVSDPANPTFTGYIDSTAVRSYPMQTLIPGFLICGVRNSYLNRNVISYQDKMVVLKNSQLTMFQIQGGTLVFVSSNTIQDGYGILPLNDTILGFQYDSVYGVTTHKKFYAVNLSYSGFYTLPAVYIGYNYDYSFPGAFIYGYCRPYIHGLSDNTIFLSTDKYRRHREQHYPVYFDSIVLSNLLTIQDIHDSSSIRTTSISGTSDLANAYNSGYSVSSVENLCTSGFPLGSSQPGNLATELFASDIKDPYPYSTASANNALYRDSVHLQNQLQNILLDTLKKHVFLIFNNNMTILSYQHEPTIRVVYDSKKPSLARGITILPCSFHSGVTIVLPAHARAADLYFYDLSGRIIDRMLGVTSNAVLWRPKTKTMGCYFVMVKNGSEKYSAKFMVR